MIYGDYTEIECPTTVEPVTWTMMKDHLKLSTDAEQDLVMAYVTSARVWCEKYLQRALVTKEVTMYYTDVGNDYALKYPANPEEYISVSADGQIVTTAPTVILNYPHRVLLFDVVIPEDTIQVTIEYTAKVYENVRAVIPAIMLMAGKMYTSREDADIKLHTTVKNILNPHRLKYKP